jgi:uncharacterized protein YndB with AHSA1/START domain
VTSIRIVRDYPYPPATVWRAVTDPDLIPRWTATGAGGRPEGFVPVAGSKFRFVAKPRPGWNGIVNCEVLEVREPSRLRFSWVGDDGGGVTEVAYRIEPRDGGSRFTYEHTGFTGVGGFVMARLLGSVRRKMLTVGLPAVLATLDSATGTDAEAVAFHGIGRHHGIGRFALPQGIGRHHGIGRTAGTEPSPAAAEGQPEPAKGYEKG